MRRTPANRGFTLVELIVAMVMTVLVTGATVGILGGMTGTRRRVDRQMQLEGEARAALRAIATALRNAYRTTEEDWFLEGADDWLGEFPADRIRFRTTSRLPVRPDEPESDVHECEFFLGDPEPNGMPALMRRLDPTLNEPPDGGGVVDRIAANVVALDFAYHDGFEWQAEWPEDLRQWPTAVRVRVVVAVKGPPRATWTASRTVNFPYRPESKDSKETEPS